MKPLPSLSLKLRRLGYRSYAEYLRGKHWQLLRANWIPRATRDGSTVCEFCFRPGRLALHHRTYKRLGREFAADLHLICSDCHDEIHETFKNGRWSLRGATRHVMRRRKAAALRRTTARHEPTEPVMRA